MEELLSKLDINVSNHTINISGNFKYKSGLRKEICKLLKLPEDTRFDSLVFNSIIPSDAFSKKVVRYLSLCTDIPIEDPDPESVIEFHADWIKRDLTPPSIQNFNQFSFEIPFSFASFLIEIFCNDQPNEARFQFTKQFLMKKTVLTLNLIAPLPVAFEFVQAKSTVRLSFADTPHIDAHKISDQVKLALNLFNTVKSFSVRFQNVCADFYRPDFLEKMSNDLNCVLLSNFIMKDQATGLITFDMIILPSRPGKDYRESLIMKFKAIFDNYFFAKRCDKCGRFFTEISSPNDECGIYEHEGNQIPFEDNQMEHIETMEDGSTITLVKYECCGEVIKGSQPQEFMKFGDIHFQENPPRVYSHFNSQTF